MTVAGKLTLITAAASGMLAVTLGAFGAHALKGQIDADMMRVYQTAVQYHFYHTFALLFVGLLMLKLKPVVWLSWSAALFTAGLVLFCGSLYLLVMTGTRWLGVITPVGGVCFITGWLLLIPAVWRTNDSGRE